jgi:hypothetical protein
LALRVALACETGPGRLHLVSSPGLWYGLPELLGRLGPGSAVLCLEAEPALAELSLRTLPEELRGDPRLAFLATDEAGAVSAAAARLGRFRRCLGLRLSGGEAFHQEGYARAAALLQAEFAAWWRSKATMMAMGRLWARNIFRNLARLEEMAPSPPPHYESAAVVCGAGPSLEASLGFIREKRARLAVLVCDTALGSLLEAGISPDLVICLEGQAHNLADFIPAGKHPLPLLADLSSHPASFSALVGPKHLTAVAIAPSPFLERLSSLGLPALACPPLGSVGVHAVHVARALCEGPVFATGLDFSSEVGKSHARGSPSLAAEEASMTRLSRWPRQYASAFRAGVRPAPEARGPFWPLGGAAPLTDPVLAGYAALLAEEARQPGPLLVDIRGRGLPLGLASVDLAEAGRLVDEAWRAKTLGEAGRRAEEGLKRGESGSGETASAAGKVLTGLAKLSRGFIETERDRLVEILAFMKGRSRLSREDFLNLVLETDYILWPLPDVDRLREAPQDLLNRLLVETEYWLWKLGEILETGGGASRP